MIQDVDPIHRMVRKASHIFPGITEFMFHRGYYWIEGELRFEHDSRSIILRQSCTPGDKQSGKRAMDAIVYEFTSFVSMCELEGVGSAMRFYDLPWVAVESSIDIDSRL